MIESHPRYLAILTALLLVLALPAAAMVVDEEEEDVQKTQSGLRENLCTQKQIEGGYEDLGDRCQLTGWNWVDANGKCVSGSCGATGCVTSLCACEGDACGNYGSDDDETQPEDAPPIPDPDFEDLWYWSVSAVFDWCEANGGKGRVPSDNSGGETGGKAVICRVQGHQIYCSDSVIGGLPDNTLVCVDGCGHTNPDRPASCDQPFALVDPGPSKWTGKMMARAAHRDVGDFNGDGLTDVISFMQQNNSTNRPAERGNVEVRLSNGKDGFEKDLAGPIWHGDFCAAFEEDQCLVGDFNGDGYDDIAAAHHFGGVDVALSTGDGFTSAKEWHPAFWLPGQVVAADFDGNGGFDLSRLINAAKDFAYVIRANIAQDVVATGGGAKGFTRFTPQDKGLGDEWSDLLCYPGFVCVAGDADADGMDDIVAFDPDNGSVLVAYSTGLSFEPLDYLTAHEVPDASTYDMADLSGDGLEDLVIVTGKGTPLVAAALPGGGFGAWLPVVGNFCDPENEECKAENNGPRCDPEGICRFGDVNGDRREDLIDFATFAKGKRNAGDVRVSLTPVWFPDLDGDGIADEDDNCLLTPNAFVDGEDGQSDFDGDGHGDVCDAECADGFDNDGDGLVDGDDPACFRQTDDSESAPVEGVFELGAKEKVKVDGEGKEKRSYDVTLEMEGDRFALDTPKGLYTGTWTTRGVLGDAWTLLFDDASALLVQSGAEPLIEDVLGNVDDFGVDAEPSLVLRFKSKKKQLKLKYKAGLVIAVGGDELTGKHRITVKGKAKDLGEDGGGRLPPIDLPDGPDQGPVAPVAPVAPIGALPGPPGGFFILE